MKPAISLAPSPQKKDFFSSYLIYANLGESECPALYHRWACASILGALIGRNAWFPFGHGKIYPNQYIMLMGPPASKKGTAIGIGKNLLKLTGYTRFAPNRTSKEAFLREMKQFELNSPESLEELESLTFDMPSEIYICAGEFVDFIGQGDSGFMMNLTDMWDNGDEYRHPKITGKDIVVCKPTVNLFGGSTPSTFALAFPVEAIGTGFLSRVIFVHSDGSGNRVAFPPPGDPLLAALLAEQLKEVKALKGEMILGSIPKEILSDIYNSVVPVDDVRFIYYMERRHIHLIKLSMLMALSDIRMHIESYDVIRANTMLAITERRMPKALGEFGASRHSAISGGILEFLDSKNLPQTSSDIWKAIHKDLTKFTELNDILESLKKAEKIQVLTVRGKTGYLPYHKPAMEWNPKFIDRGWLTSQELIL